MFQTACATAYRIADKLKLYHHRRSASLDTRGWQAYAARMAETPESLVLEHLGPIRTDIAVLRTDMREVKERLGILEQQYASLSRRIDLVYERIERIEKRLELTPAP